MQSDTLKVTVPLLGLMNINFFNVAYKMLGIYEELEEINRQKSMRHLGLISTVFDNVSHSRWDYLMLQCGITELVKKMHAGTEYFALGTIKINGKEYDGESIIKTWFMFSNFGHLKNTLEMKKQ
ncbi:hypothetical protein [Lysinibacillus capsici]|uniref:hypothetical protein n=1 Tax=Lysinibacillus capsici TaxID=2115968 RepID=UPI002A837151|nr:hypothetical protein [Lysinibacillus capsici]